METIDLSKDEFFMRNHLGQMECKLCLTLHPTEGKVHVHFHFHATLMCNTCSHFWRSPLIAAQVPTWRTHKASAIRRTSAVVLRGKLSA